MRRPDPFTLVFGAVADAWFPAIRREAERERRDVTDRSQFAALREVQHALTSLELPDAVQDHPGAAQEYLAALYAGYRYWDAGCRLLDVPRPGLEGALVARPGGGLRLPAPACYLRLPAHWFWGRVGDTGSWEPLDGLFVTRDLGGREFSLLFVLGLREDRAGFSQLSLRTTAEDAAAARDEAGDAPFPSRLTGGDRAGVRSVVSAAEAILLAHLALVATAE